MGNKWSTVSVSGYGASNPSDDGAATEANKVKYSTITTNLTDPLKTSVESIVTNLDELFTETTTAVSTSYTTVASDHATWLEVTGTTTVTLLAASTAGAGYRVGVKNAGAGVVTVARSGSDTIDGATSIAVDAGDSAGLIVNAAGNGYIHTKSRANWYESTGFRAVRSTSIDPSADNNWVRVSAAYSSESYDYGSLFNISNGKYTPGASHADGVFVLNARVGFTDSGGAGLDSGTYVGVALTRFDSGDNVLGRDSTIIAMGSVIAPTVHFSTIQQISNSTNYFAVETYCSETDHLLATVVFMGGRIK